MNLMSSARMCGCEEEAALQREEDRKRKEEEKEKKKREKQEYAEQIDQWRIDLANYNTDFLLKILEDIGEKSTDIVRKTHTTTVMRLIAGKSIKAEIIISVQKK